MYPECGDFGLQWMAKKKVRMLHGPSAPARIPVDFQATF